MITGVRAHDFGRKTPSELFRNIKDSGFDAIQLALTKAISGVESFVEINDSVLDNVKTALNNTGLQLAVLGCYVNLAHPNKVVREIETEYYKKALLQVKKLGGTVVGSETSSFNSVTMEIEPAFTRLMESVKSIIEKARITDTIAGIEPVCCHTLHSIELTERMLREGKSKHLKIIFDPVNMIPISGLKNNEQIIKECLDAFGDDIIAIHLKDVTIKDGMFKRVQLGTGDMRYEYMFEWLKKNKPDIAVLREECQMDAVAEEVEYIHKMIQ